MKKGEEDPKQVHTVLWWGGKNIQWGGRKGGRRHKPELMPC